MSYYETRLHTLPTLVQTEIIVQIGLEASLRSLFKAIPSVRSHFKQYEISILHGIFRNLMPDDQERNILKDVLAVIDLNSGKYDNGDFKEMLRDRRRKELSRPPDLRQLRQVWLLISRIILLIEDNVSKATSLYPPRAYMGLPDLEWGIGSKFKGQSLETRPVSFTSLGRHERYRLLRAFVRYQLLCKAHRTFSSRFMTKDIFESHIFDGDNAPDLSAFSSTHDYYKALWGAVFAQSGDSWLPELPTECHGAPTSLVKSPRRLLYPDNTFFDADRYFNDLSLGTEHRPDLVDELANCGLGLVCGTLNNLSEAQDWGGLFKIWLKELIMKVPKFSPWIYEIGYYRRWGRRTLEELVPEAWEFFSSKVMSSSDRDSLRPYIAKNLRVNQIIADEQLELCERPYVRQAQIYRQRAWGLLDDERLYANTIRPFPTFEQLHVLETLLDREGGPELQRQRRSQLWQDLWMGKRSSVIAGGLRQSDNSVTQSRLPGRSTPLWNTSGQRLWGWKGQHGGGGEHHAFRTG